MSHRTDQARFYELQGSLSATPPEELPEEPAEEPAEECGEPDGQHARKRNGTRNGSFGAVREEARRATRGLQPVPDASTAAEPKPESAPRNAASPIRPRLPVWVRVSLVLVAVLLLALGVAGLFLPGLQGILTLMVALAVLSLVSRSMHRLLRWSLKPWPTMRKRVERYRRRSHAWLHLRVDRFEAWRRARRRTAGAGASDADRGGPKDRDPSHDDPGQDDPGRDDPSGHDPSLDDPGQQAGSAGAGPAAARDREAAPQAADGGR